MLPDSDRKLNSHRVSFNIYLFCILLFLIPNKIEHEVIQLRNIVFEEIVFSPIAEIKISALN